MKLRTLKFYKSELPEFLHDCFDFYGGDLALEKVAKRQICKFQIPRNKIPWTISENQPLIYDMTMYKEVDGCIVDCYDFLHGTLIIAYSGNSILKNETFMAQTRYNVMLAGIHIARKDTELFNLVVLPYFDLIFDKLLGPIGSDHITGLVKEHAEGEK